MVALIVLAFSRTSSAENWVDEMNATTYSPQLEHGFSTENRQRYRNWVYGAGTVVFTAATINNYIVAD